MTQAENVNSPKIWPPSPREQLARLECPGCRSQPQTPVLSEDGRQAVIVLQPALL